jgi:hypothetical protein
MYTPFACSIVKRSPLGGKFTKYAVVVTLAVAAGSAARCTSDDGQTATVKLNDAAAIEMLSENAPGYVIFPPFNTTGERDRLTEAVKLDLNPHPGGLDLNETVFIQVTIDTLGSIIHTQALSSQNTVARQEAVRAVESTNFTFKPLMENGKTVESMVVIPVVFGNGGEVGSVYDRI